MRFVRRLGGCCVFALPTLLTLVLAAWPAALDAQTTSASVSGIVQDAQGGVLPGVTVTMTSRTRSWMASDCNSRRSPTTTINFSREY